MSPDISTRCLECGAAVRPDALFCPECGRPSNQAADRPDRGPADSETANTEMDELADNVETDRDAVEPEPDAVEPELDAVEPEFDAVEPEFDEIEPGRDAVEPERDDVEPELDLDGGEQDQTAKTVDRGDSETGQVAADPLKERLAKLKAEAQRDTAPSATIMSAPAETVAAVAPPVVVMDKPKKRSSGGRVVASSRGSSRWSAVSKPAKVLAVDPALRFLLVTAGLFLFSLLVYLLSRYIK